jgi:3-oxocholest-4-en-26-oate---CoA ligase
LKPVGGSGWSFAQVWETVAAAQPERTAVIQGETIQSWAMFDARSRQLATQLQAAGVAAGAHIAIAMQNSADYLAAMFAAWKCGAVPFNVNYHYSAREILDLLTRGDAQAVIFDASLAERLAQIDDELTQMRCWINVDARAGDSNPGSLVPHDPSGTDRMILFTGGTTGRPAGVIWQQDDLFTALGGGADPFLAVPPFDTLDDVVGRLPLTATDVTLIACPLMHGTGLFSAMMALATGRAVALLPPGRFDAAVLWDEAERLMVTRIVIVGMAFCVPMLEALEAHPQRWPLPHLQLIASSGAMWSAQNKHGMLKHLPHISLNDALGSSEAVGLAGSLSRSDAVAQTAGFQLGPHCAVFDEDDEPVPAGSGRRGRLAIGGPLPQGYYGDPEKTARTFKTIGGIRWSFSGDWATVGADGSVLLLGRGSQCINTGGEKVFPEEVEEVIKSHPAIRDAAVIGLSDDRFGEIICALVELRDNIKTLDLGSVQSHVRSELAPFKVPRRLLVLPSLNRGANGKLNYPALKAIALA